MLKETAIMAILTIVISSTLKAYATAASPFFSHRCSVVFRSASLFNILPCLLDSSIFYLFVSPIGVL